MLPRRRRVIERRRAPRLLLAAAATVGILGPLATCRGDVAAPPPAREKTADEAPRPDAPPPRAVANAAPPAGAAVPPAGAAAHAADYPVSTKPPKDAVNEELLRALAKEATAIFACHLKGLSDLFPERRDPDTFYDAACDVAETFRGPLRAGTAHFVWQVERGNRMPPPDAELLVHVKRRTKPLEEAPALEWIALDTGVLRYVPKLRDRMHRTEEARQKNK